MLPYKPEIRVCAALTHKKVVSVDDPAALQDVRQSALVLAEEHSLDWRAVLLVCKAVRYVTCSLSSAERRCPAISI